MLPPGRRSAIGRRWHGTIAIVLALGHAHALDPRKVITHYSHTVLRTADGLPQDSVRAIAQTTDGYIWLGTEAGLARFDGVSFTVFNRRNSAVKAITCLRFARPAMDLYGSGSATIAVWQHWRRERGLFTVLSGFHVRALLEDNEGVLWAGADDLGLVRVQRGITDTEAAGNHAFDDIRSRRGYGLEERRLSGRGPSSDPRRER